MSAHPDLRPLLDGAELDRESRARLLAHVRDCAACRTEIAVRDPSLLFTLLACEPVPASVLDQLSERTAAAMAAERRPRRAVPGWAWGAVAASLLTLGVFGTLMNRSGVDPPPPLPREVVATPPLPSDPAALPAGMIELFDSPGTADVVEMTVGDVDVVMIFDEAMKI